MANPYLVPSLYVVCGQSAGVCCILLNPCAFHPKDLKPWKYYKDENKGNKYALCV